MPLTYASNWTDYQRVPFWDALDVIGIQAYFPLSETPEVTASSLAAAWGRKMDELRAFASAHHRRVLFTELGYNRSLRAAVTRWSYEVDGPEAEDVQALVLEAALEAIDHEPAVAGVFLWKWFPGPRPAGRNFQLATPRLRSVIAAAWGGTLGGRLPRSPACPYSLGGPTPGLARTRP